MVSIFDILKWARENQVTLVPCKAKTKSPAGFISKNAIYPNDPEMRADDSFHNATQERMEVIKNFWDNIDPTSTRKNISASIEMNPGFNHGVRMCCIDVDCHELVERFMNSEIFADCPAISGMKGVKLFFKIIETSTPDKILQFFSHDDGKRAKLEIFTQERHAIVFGEHPDSPAESPVYYEFVRGFGDSIPSIQWNIAKNELQNIVAEFSLETRAERKKRLNSDGKPATKPRPTKTESHSKMITDVVNLRIEDIAMPLPPIIYQGDEIRGTNPWHDSTTGNNFIINPSKNTWRCFRCASGGDAITAYAISKGIIECADAPANSPKGINSCLSDHWGEIFKCLREDGYDIPEPERKKSKSRKKSDEKPEPPKIIRDKKYTLRALNLLKQEGRPIEYMLNTFAKEHIGDRVVAECLIISLASQIVYNTSGIHCFISGNSGKGKSHSATTILKQQPPELRLAGSLSNKVMFYMDNFTEGSVIVYDDKAMSDEMAEIFKNTTSNFVSGYSHYTLTTNREAEELKFPPRCVWWIVKVEDAGDEQVQNRMLMPWIDDSEKQDKNVNQFQLNEETKPLSKRIKDQGSNFVCQEMWRIIKTHKIFVRIPFANFIKFGSFSNRRDTGMLLDMIKSYAAINVMNRNPKITTVDDEQVIMIDATIRDFESARALDESMPKEGGGSKQKLIKNEAMCLDSILNLGKTEFTLNDIQDMMSLSYSSVRRIFHGRDARGDDAPAGLLAKCPAISVTKTTKREDDDGTGQGATVHQNLYHFDKKVYLTWIGKDGLFLDHNEWNNSPDKNDPDDFEDFDIADYTIDTIVENLPHLTEEEEISDDEKSFDDAIKDFTPKYCKKPDQPATQESDVTSITEPTSEPVTPAKQPTTPKRITASKPQHVKTSQKPERDPSKKTFAVNPNDFIRVHDLAVEPCDCCGSTGWWYVEKFTADMKANGVTPRHICKKCYDEAYKEQTFQETERLKYPDEKPDYTRVDYDVGICDICERNQAVFKENGSAFYICEECYQEMMRQYNASRL